MLTTEAKFTVLYEDPFWIGILERRSGQRYEVCKVTFGSEPKTTEVYDFYITQGKKLAFGSADEETAVVEKRINPKRRQRQAKKEVSAFGIGTKAQQALQAQREQLKTERKQLSKEQKEAEAKRRFQLRQAKKQQKHRGH